MKGSATTGASTIEPPPPWPVARSADAQTELALQGSLFGEPESDKAAPADRSEPAAGELSDSELGADAAARPRQRRPAEAKPADSDSSPDEDSPDSDEPAWAHHSQVDPQQLTPMLRHYVELKAAHPERVLLYRLEISSNASLKTPSPCHGCWNSP